MSKPPTLSAKELWIRLGLLRMTGRPRMFLNEDGIPSRALPDIEAVLPSEDKDEQEIHGSFIPHAWIEYPQLGLVGAGHCIDVIKKSKEPEIATDKAIGPLRTAWQEYAPAMLHAAWPDIKGEDGYLEPIEQDGMLQQDALFASAVRAIGDRGKCLADEIEKGSKKRWKRYQRTMDDRLLWKLWVEFLELDDENAGSPPPWVQCIFEVLWFDVVRPQLEREAKKPNVRMSKELARTITQGWISGGTPVGKQILVVPPKGVALALPFDDGLRVASKSNGLVGIKQVLSDAQLKTYLATLLLFQDCGMRDDGSFEIDGPSTILDITGAHKKQRVKGDKTYEEYDSRLTKMVSVHFGIFSETRVRAVGHLEASAGDPLVDEIKDRRNGKLVCYAHSRLIVGHLRTQYFQIPREVCRLDTCDMPSGLGIAMIIREHVLAHIKSGKPIEASIATWLAASGINAKELVRKHGHSFWEAAADRFIRVADEGGFGALQRHGQGEDIVLSVSVLSPALQTGYGKLVDASKAQESAKRTARVADHRRSRRTT